MIRFIILVLVLSCLDRKTIMDGLLIILIYGFLWAALCVYLAPTKRTNGQSEQDWMINRFLDGQIRVFQWGISASEMAKAILARNVFGALGVLWSFVPSIDTRASKQDNDSISDKEEEYEKEDKRIDMLNKAKTLAGTHIRTQYYKANGNNIPLHTDSEDNPVFLIEEIDIEEDLGGDKYDKDEKDDTKYVSVNDVDESFFAPITPKMKVDGEGGEGGEEKESSKDTNEVKPDNTARDIIRKRRRFGNARR